MAEIDSPRRLPLMLRHLSILSGILLLGGCTDLANLFAKPPERCPGDPVAVCDAAVVACYLGPHCKKGPFEFAPNCTRLCRLVRAECEARCFPPKPTGQSALPR